MSMLNENKNWILYEPLSCVQTMRKFPLIFSTFAPFSLGVKIQLGFVHINRHQQWLTMCILSDFFANNVSTLTAGLLVIVSESLSVSVNEPLASKPDFQSPASNFLILPLTN